jgi:predicted Zn finger-like uncharacterized protein
MPGQKVACPECDAQLRIDETVPAGKKIKCPECDTVFPLPDPDAEAVTPTRRVARAGASGDEGDWDDDSRPRSRRQSQDTRAMVIASIAFGAILLLGGGALAVVLLTQPGPKNDEQAQKTPALVQNFPVDRLRQQGGGPHQPGVKIPQQVLPPPGLNPNAQPGDGALALGKPAPDIDGVDQDGKKLKLSDFKGKVVLLDFWSQY